jgi:peptide/nickel transport system ATP-binding protein
MASVLEIEHLSVALGIGGRLVPALDDVSFSIRRGEALGLIGESGSGKSLTALSVPGLLPANARITGGSIRLLGDELVGKPEAELNRLRARSVAFVFQNPTTYLNPLLTIGRQISELFEASPELLEVRGRISNREKRALAWAKSIEALRLVKIPDPERVVRQYPFELSGGMQQRAVIAMGLVRRPHLIIADEITTALDVTVQAQILRLLAELRQSIEMTLLLITHDMGIVAQLADRVAVMYSGRIAEIGPVRDVVQNPLHPYAKGLMGAIPTLASDAARLVQIPGSMPRLSAIPPGCPFNPRCALAFDRCRTERPEPIANGTQAVACHLYDAATTETAA